MNKPEMIVACLLAVLPAVAGAQVSGEIVQAPSTNHAPDSSEMRARVQAEREKVRENRARLQAERLKALNESWPKDEPRIFEWDADRCRNELPGARTRETKARDEIARSLDDSKRLIEKIGETDPELKPLNEEVNRLAGEIARLNKELSAKRQELSKKSRDKAESSPEMKEIEKKRLALAREFGTAASIRQRIEIRLEKLSAGSATNAVSGAGSPKKDAAGM